MKFKVFLPLIIVFSIALGQDIIETGVSETSDQITPSTTLSNYHHTSPCDDSLLQLLKTKELLTQTEVYYRTQKEKECIEYSDSLKEAIQDSISKPEKEARWQKKKQAIIAGIVMGVIAEIVFTVIVLNSEGSVWVSND